jgi:hypothetical protein
MIFNDRRNAKALKAANGPSLAPKGYKPDTAGRKAVHEIADTIEKGTMYAEPSSVRKKNYVKAAKAKDLNMKII